MGMFPGLNSHHWEFFPMISAEFHAREKSYVPVVMKEGVTDVRDGLQLVILLPWAVFVVFGATILAGGGLVIFLVVAFGNVVVLIPEVVVVLFRYSCEILEVRSEMFTRIVPRTLGSPKKPPAVEAPLSSSLLTYANEGQ